MEEYLKRGTEDDFKIVEALTAPGQIHAGALQQWMTMYPAFRSWMEKRAKGSPQNCGDRNQRP
jgi:hypothetical protein